MSVVAVWPWANYLTSLDLNVLIRKIMGMDYIISKTLDNREL